MSAPAPPGTCNSHQHQGGDQRRLAADAVAVVTENCGADRSRDEADRIDAECFQGADQRIRLGKEQFGENEPGDHAVKKEVIPFDRRSNRAGSDGPPQLSLMVEFRQSGWSRGNACHGFCSSRWSGCFIDAEV
jgi:hypothetical protein